MRVAHALPMLLEGHGFCFRDPNDCASVMTTTDTFDIHRHMPSHLDISGFMLIDKKAERPCASLVPGTLFGTSDNNDVVSHIIGPVCRAAVSQQNPVAFMCALVASGAVLPGNEQEVTRVDSLLSSPVSSRTASYLCSITRNCTQLIQAFSNVNGAAVVIIGCGGIGSLAALILAGAGIARVRLIDHDTIEASNLNRQLFWTRNDIGRRKVDVLAEAIHHRFPDVEVEMVRTDYQASVATYSMSGIHIVLASADRPVGLIRSVLAEAQRFRIPVIHAGYFQHFAAVRVYTDEKQVRCNEVSWKVLPNAVMPSFGPTNAELAGLASSIAMQLIARLLDSQYLNMTWSTRFPRSFIGAGDGN